MTKAAAPAPGALVGGFRIESEIGRGGMGVVYKATQLSLARPVALKLISRELAQEERFRERFLREARLAASIDHPHLLPVYEAGEANGTLFLAMRLVEGLSLAQLLRREGALSPERALRLASQLASALHAAHEAGLLHRDVKPPNVLLAGLGEAEHAYLCDFGLARRLAGGSLTQERAFLGTASYAAPEQIRGEALDARCDLYALACLIYESLTGAPPFQAEDELALCWAHLHEPPASPSSVDPALAPFDPFFRRALAKDPNERFSSAIELARNAEAALRTVLAAAPPAVGRSLELPRPPTSFVGRERELQAVLELLLDEDVRLLTLAGPGGTGKTRLALRAAEEAAPAFLDGVYWTALASLRDPDLVLTTVAQALEVPEAPGVAVSDTIARTFARKHALVLLDNCEHLIDPVADLVRTLLERCPTLVIAASSRARLGLRAERVFAVPPMERAEGEELFLARARAANAQFAPTADIPAICAAVDGLPLALELAAARVRTLSTKAILERLGERLSLLASRDRDVDDRQRTLEATIAWSYDLLGPVERQALRALSVFAGGCSLDAAREVAGADVDLLESLLDKSLLRHLVDDAGRDRYSMLETIREYAARELERHGEAEAARDRHTAWVFTFMREVAPRWGDPAPPEKLHRVLAEEGNIRLALSRAIELEAANEALELVGLIGRTWLDFGRLVEMDARAGDALALGGGEAGVRGVALISAAVARQATRGVEDLTRARELLEEAGMPREAAYATMVMGIYEGERGSVDRGLELLEKALAEFDELDESYGAEITRDNVTYLRDLRWPVDPVEARLSADHSRDVAAKRRRTGDPGDEIDALHNLSHALIDAGELDEAYSTALHAARLLRQSQIGRRNLGGLVAALARCAGLRGDCGQALRLSGALRSVTIELGITLPVTRTAAVDAAMAKCRLTLDDEAVARATAEGEMMTVEALLDYVAALE